MTQADPRTSGMVHLMEKLAPVEGYNLSELEDIRFLRSNRPLARTQVLYDPGIVILCQGRKRGTTWWCPFPLLSPWRPMPAKRNRC
jgi:hypothetical protein